jgi:hypothetical protein
MKTTRRELEGTSGVPPVSVRLSPAEREEWEAMALLCLQRGWDDARPSDVNLSQYVKDAMRKINEATAQELGTSIPAAVANYRELRVRELQEELDVAAARL